MATHRRPGSGKGSGKYGINTNSVCGACDEATATAAYESVKRNVRPIVTANCASNNAITAVANSNHRSQRGVVNCFLRFIFLRNMFILLIVVSSLLVSTTDAAISSRGELITFHSRFENFQPLLSTLHVYLRMVVNPLRCKQSLAKQKL
uniref:Transmembrane protein n=1 Tax=Anopheles culicifacies TaxID=139723 RepID=A0A182M7M3_9DIPT